MKSQYSYNVLDAPEFQMYKSVEKKVIENAKIRIHKEKIAKQR